MAASKLVFYNHTGEVSGAEVVLLDLLRGLDRSRFVPVILCPPGPLVEASLSLNTLHTVVPALAARFTANPFKLLRYLVSVLVTVSSVRAALKAERADLIHANSVRAGLVATFASTGLGVPVVWHIHDILPASLLAKLIRAIADRAPNTSLLAVSHATARSFEGSKPVTVVHNSIDLDRFRPNPESRERLRRELGLRDDQIAVGVIGQLTPRKRQLELIEVFALNPVPNTILLVIGTAQFHAKNRVYADRLAQRVEQLGLKDRVWLLGKREDMPGVMNALDFLAQNSSNEPLGLAIMEGAACGRPAAATAVDGVPEVIDDNVTGLLSDPGNSADLVRKIATLAADPALRQQMGLRGRQKMVSEFGPSLQMIRMQAYYSQLLQRQEVHA